MYKRFPQKEEKRLRDYWESERRQTNTRQTRKQEEAMGKNKFMLMKKNVVTYMAI
jgi:hypothetical protein